MSCATTIRRARSNLTGVSAVGEGQHWLAPPAAKGSSQEVCDASCGGPLDLCLHRKVRCGPGRHQRRPSRPAARRPTIRRHMPEQSIQDPAVLEAQSVAAERGRLGLGDRNFSEALATLPHRTWLDKGEHPSGNAVMMPREGRAMATRHRSLRSPGWNPPGRLHRSSPIDSRVTSTDDVGEGLQPERPVLGAHWSWPLGLTS